MALKHYTVKALSYNSKTDQFRVQTTPAGGAAWPVEHMSRKVFEVLFCSAERASNLTFKAGKDQVGKSYPMVSGTC